ncbi:hypothetical protein IIA15_03100 [candidate division TA06 bacterium]|nr:hypothetical protein [candidate division TA06 bacterium]
MKKNSANGSRVVLINEPDALRVYEIYNGPRRDTEDSLGKIFLNFWKENHPRHPVIYTSVCSTQVQENRKLRKILKERTAVID